MWQRANPFTIVTQIDIDAPTPVVWEVLTDFDAYPDWNPTSVGMAGTPETGETLWFAADASDDALTFEPVVLEVRPNEHLRWEGKHSVTGLFDGGHSLDLQPLPDGGTRLIQMERFRGIIVPVLTGWLTENSPPDFIAMNEAPRNRAVSSNSAN